MSITWTSTAGTIYGGYVDLVNGELVQEWELVSAQWGNIKKNNVHNETTGYYEAVLSFNNEIEILHETTTYGVKTISNVIGKVAWNGGGATPEHYYGGNVNGHGIIYAYGNYNDDLIVQIAATLKTPIHYSLTPQQLKSLLGTNNIWSNANGNTTVEYWKH